MFEDPAKEIENYLKLTSVFPLNTLLTVKESAVRENPGLVGQVIAACTEARRRYHEELHQASADHMGIGTADLYRLQVFPNDYGLEPNLSAIRTMVHYCYEQGPIRKLYAPEELFVETDA